MSSIAPVSGFNSSQPTHAVPPVRAAGRDNDGDEATESAASKAKEASSLAASGPRGTQLNKLV